MFYELSFVINQYFGDNLSVLHTRILLSLESHHSFELTLLGLGSLLCNIIDRSILAMCLGKMSESCRVASYFSTSSMDK